MSSFHQGPFPFSFNLKWHKGLVFVDPDGKRAVELYITASLWDP